MGLQNDPEHLGVLGRESQELTRSTKSPLGGVPLLNQSGLQQGGHRFGDGRRTDAGTTYDFGPRGGPPLEQDLQHGPLIDFVEQVGLGAGHSEAIRSSRVGNIVNGAKYLSGQTMGT
jgi:hypothetical protein